ncbi:hypothetical protein RFI_36477 [Reticulomyxa filosa]|uniref:Uncharacterized protein n=1 Tax=Reticulomyxa filosa TaxID=46433 RepID=X6LHA3_RETFI|nr:hypothetical protein RFI_36477 [Reticulomyxa filosa]|eukprot:ETO00964.1 hypothetical protein RFI_36477 [Reticulomyxa filosa]
MIYLFVFLKKCLIIVGFCFDVRKQTGANDNNINDEEDAAPSPQAPLPKIKFKIEDYMKLFRRKAVVVKYIGEIDLMKGDIIDLKLGIHGTLTAQ